MAGGGTGGLTALRAEGHGKGVSRAPGQKVLFLVISVNRSLLERLSPSLSLELEKSHPSGGWVVMKIIAKSID